ncbi:MAG: hypothetical protein GX776_03530, partial [Oxalobacter sp.]|nr:hypothetical protein [Oxalobacter sp.]
MPVSPLYSDDRRFRTRLSWPVLAGVLGTHALLVAWMLMANAPSSPAITPPMMGILLSDASSSEEGQTSGVGASLAGAAPAVQKTEKRTEQQVTKKHSTENKTAETAEKTGSANTAGGASRTASTHGTEDAAAKADNTG